MTVIRSKQTMRCVCAALDLADVSPDRRLCALKARQVLTWPATTRSDWLAAQIVEQYIMRPRIRKEARKAGMKARWG